jgi:hypothetical protein
MGSAAWSGFAASALAQQPPPPDPPAPGAGSAPTPPPAPPPDAPPAPAATTPSAAPAATAAPPTDPNATTAPVAPPADKAEKKAAPPKPLPWRATNLIWGHQLSTTVVGLGYDLQSSAGESYAWAFSANPGYFVLDQRDHKVRLVLNLNADYELTNSDFTTRDKEFLFGDIGVGPTYIGTLLKAGGGGDPNKLTAAQRRDPTLAGGSEYITTLLVGGRLFFPTSKFSLSQGINLRTSLFAGVRQTIKLLGNSAPGLQNITMTLSESWRHVFARATTPTNAGLNWQRQDATGATFDSDQLSAGALDENALVHALDIVLPIYGDLQVFSSFNLTNVFPYTFAGSSCEAQTLTGCVQADRMEDRTAMRVQTGFDFTLYYQLLPELGIDLGYSNFAGQIGPNGQYRDFFYSPNAFFHSDLFISLDAIYKRIETAVAPAPAKTAMLPARFAQR